MNQNWQEGLNSLWFNLSVQIFGFDTQFGNSKREALDYISKYETEYQSNDKLTKIFDKIRKLFNQNSENLKEFLRKYQKYTNNLKKLLDNTEYEIKNPLKK